MGNTYNKIVDFKPFLMFYVLYPYGLKWGTYYYKPKGENENEMLAL